ncbi:MAG TPA: glycolate oxidase subunit GlcF [Xanthobacteraceae bacterium]|jgi:glycolate oxidase iron-sulfur subunit|nr:glycolate oxidase subunit GlcF [Xanthobacteraceae bacterium]
MQTLFTLAQLADPEVAESERILRTCVHCGFCTATCPTYVLGGDELDSPRGRIYLIKDMLENDRRPTPELVKHVDRCLSCLACMTTCPSGVHYMHLVDHARVRIEESYRRPRRDRWLRTVLARILPNDTQLRWALRLARWARPLAGLFAACGFAPIAAMLRLAPARLPQRGSAQRQRVFAAEGERRGRVALLTGCVGPVLRPSINQAAISLLTRHGIEVVLASGQGCCGAVAHHLGRQHEALAAARANIDAWSNELGAGGLDAILVTASGCGTMVKDYGFMLRGDSAYAAKAERITALARDISEYLTGLDMSRASGPASAMKGLVVAYHAACSLQHGQKIGHQPKELLCKMGFVVKDVPEEHLCCGSAGTYNILQPDIAKRLRDRKVRNIEGVAPDVIAAGNIGCITQIAAGTRIPVVHTVELIDWATGGREPEALKPKEPASER